MRIWIELIMNKKAFVQAFSKFKRSGKYTGLKISGQLSKSSARNDRVIRRMIVRSERPPAVRLELLEGASPSIWVLFKYLRPQNLIYHPINCKKTSNYPKNENKRFEISPDNIIIQQYNSGVRCNFPMNQECSIFLHVLQVLSWNCKKILWKNTTADVKHPPSQMVWSVCVWYCSIVFSTT